MTIKAKAIQTLFRAGRLTEIGVEQAVVSGIISTNDYYAITGRTCEIATPPEPPLPNEMTTPPEETFSNTEETNGNVEKTETVEEETGEMFQKENEGE